MIHSWSGRLLAAAVLLLQIQTSADADDPPGVLWETTSQTVMEGLPMQMPIQKNKVCAPREWTQPPPSANEACVYSDFQRDGSKATWTVTCTGDMPMTGTGEMNFEGEDSYSGTVKMSAEMVTMTINLSGTKIGTCNNPLS